MTTTDYARPAQASGMRSVSHEEFFAAIGGPRNIHPSPQGRWDNATGYVSEWRDQSNRALVGVSDGGTHLCPSRYWLK